MVYRELADQVRHSQNVTQYRFRTPHRSGKWYNSLDQAQRFANVIGAGFLDPTGSFVAYRGTVLELREKG